MLIFVATAGDCAAKPWRGIVPLHSSKKVVYELLGKPTRQAKYSSSFELPNEIVEILFAKGGPCGTTLIDSWRVPPDTVLSIRVVPRKEVKFETQEGLVKVQDLTQKSIFHYSDNAEGIRYTVENGSLGERVIIIDYFPAAVDRHLSCSSSPQAKSVPIFEQYGVISATRENAILDNFAIQLINDPALTGKVVLRRGQYSLKFVTKRIRYIKNYLLTRRRIPANRISAFEVAAGRDFTVELYLVSKASVDAKP